MIISVYALAEDGRYGTSCFIFETESAMDDHIWQIITPDNWGGKPMTTEAWRERFDNDWSEAMDTYMPDGLTFQTEEKTIEIPMNSAPIGYDSFIGRVAFKNGEGSEHVAYCHPVNAPVIANATLIAAAPDMLAALKGMVADHGGNFKKIAAAMSAALTIIAKAEGGL